MEIKNKGKFSNAREWYAKNNALRFKMKDECLLYTTELVKEYGIESVGSQNTIVFPFDEDNQPSVLSFGGFSGEPDYCIIQSIVYDKTYGGLTLLYGEEQWEYVKYSDVILDDRMYLLDVIISQILN